MELSANFKQLTLQDLEYDDWGDAPADSSYLISRCMQLRRVPLNEFTVEDLRIVIGQQLGLKYLIPLAIGFLTEEILAEGHFYPGDLLSSVIKTKAEFWLAHQDLWLAVKMLIENNIEIIDEAEIDTGKFYAVNFEE